MGSFLYGDADALEPMEVSALRLETASENLPARIQVLDQADIEQSGAVDLVELLRREANLQVRSTLWEFSKSLRCHGWVWGERRASYFGTFRRASSKCDRHVCNRLVFHSIGAG